MDLAGLRLIGAGHKVPKGIFVVVNACVSEKDTLDNGLTLTRAQVCQSLRLSYSITFASVVQRSIDLRETFCEGAGVVMNIMAMQTNFKNEMTGIRSV